MEFIIELINDYTIRTVAQGAAVLGIVSGALGAFALLRRQSLLGDAISHAALPGIAIAFLLTGSKSQEILLLGAAIAGWIATLKINAVTNNTRIKQDSSLGMILSVFFGFGLVLLTYIQRLPDSTQVGLDKFLFGQAATLIMKDVHFMAIVGSVVLFFILLFWKEFKIISFDSEYSRAIGFHVKFFDMLLTTLLVVVIVLGLQMVGVVLMSAMVVAPAAAARQWSNRLWGVVFLSAFIGMFAGVSGSVISSIVPKLPTGPTIILCLSAIVAFSLLFAPKRGVIYDMYRRSRNRRNMKLDSALLELYALWLQHEGAEHGHTAQVIALSGGLGNTVDATLDELAARGYAKEVSAGLWSITSSGCKYVGTLMNKPEGEDA